jgi:hypothetical protein
MKDSKYLKQNLVKFVVFIFSLSWLIFGLSISLIFYLLQMSVIIQLVIRVNHSVSLLLRVLMDSTTRLSAKVTGLMLQGCAFGKLIYFSTTCRNFFNICSVVQLGMDFELSHYILLLTFIKSKGEISIFHTWRFYVGTQLFSIYVRKDTLSWAFSGT